jgi:phosphatidylglycerophosphate synthase
MGVIKEAFSTVPNWISMSRLVLLVPLWIWASQGRFEWVAWGLIIVAATDLLDGMVARIFKQCSEIGEKLDSWADHFILVSAVIWVFLYLGDIFPAGRILWMIPPILLFITANLIGVIKNRHYGGTHILEGKILAVFGYLGIVLFLFGIYSEVIYGFMIGSWVVHSTVNIIFHYRPDWFNKHQRSLILGLLGVEFEEGPIRYFFS